VTDITRPDHDTRLAILRKRAAYDGIEISEEALAVIAAAITTNVRALEGALIRVVAVGSLSGRPLDVALAGEALARHGFSRPPDRAISIAEVQRAACAFFDVSLADLLSRSRNARLAWARQCAMYLSRELTDYSLPRIGREFDSRDHTTVLHACKRVADHVVSDPRALSDIEGLTAALTPVE
jgi:chromosomal replication initiator protein